MRYAKCVSQCVIDVKRKMRHICVMTGDAHFRLRIPRPLKEWVEENAKRNNRSINAEIISRLESTRREENELGNPSLSMVNYLKEKHLTLTMMADIERSFLSNVQRRGLAQNIVNKVKVYSEVKLDFLEEEKKKTYEEFMKESDA